MKGRKFIRAETVRHLKIGKKRRKLQKWRRPKGTHSKVRKQRFGYLASPSIGYKRPDSMRGLIKNKRPVHISNMKELSKINPHSAVVFSRVIGARKRIQLLKIAQEKNITVLGSGGNKR
jgi:large subunit ribosomal protein L32e